MYFSNIANPELKHFHHTLGADFTMTLTQILHKTNGEYDNKLFQVEEIITDSLYRIYPLFYCNTVTSSNSNDKVSNTRCLIVLKQTGKETYFSFMTDESKSNVIIDETLIYAKTIRDSLTVEEFNALVYRLRKYGTLSGVLNYENSNEITGTYATYTFNNTNGQLRNDAGLIINNRLKNNPVTVKLSNPFFVNARYILTFTVRSLTSANVCNNTNDDYKVTDTFTLELINGVEVPLDLSEYVNDSVLSFDVSVNVSFDVPEIVNGAFTLTLDADTDSITIGDTVDLTATLTGTVVANYNIEFYEDNVLIDTVATDNTGKAVLENYEPLTSGAHVYLCKFTGIEASTNVTVNKKISSLNATANKNTMYYGEEYILNGVLLINNEAVSNLNVDVYDNNVFITTLTTDNEGKVQYSSSNLIAGNHNFRLKYEGSTAHEPSTSSILPTIIYAPTVSISTTSNNPVITTNYTISGVVKDDNTVFKNKTVELYNDSTLVATLTTDNQGVYSKTFNVEALATFNYKAVFTDGDYTTNSETITITTVKIPTIIEPNTTEFDMGDTLIVAVRNQLSGELIPITPDDVLLDESYPEEGPFVQFDSTHVSYTFTTPWPYAFMVLFKETSTYQPSRCVIEYGGDPNYHIG